MGDCVRLPHYNDGPVYSALIKAYELQYSIHWSSNIAVNNNINLWNLQNKTKFKYTRNFRVEQEMEMKSIFTWSVIRSHISGFKSLKITYGQKLLLQINRIFTPARVTVCCQCTSTTQCISRRVKKQPHSLFHYEQTKPETFNKVICS